jgi:uroporphyrinogen-III synthase
MENNAPAMTEKRLMSGLHLKIILVTRPKNQAEEFIRLLEEAGARALSAPMIEIVPPESWAECDRTIRQVGTYDYILFTSANAVEKFFERALLVDGWSLSAIRQKTIYAVGKMTKRALEVRGCRVSDIPEKSTAEDLGRLLLKIEVRGKKILCPRGNLGSSVLPALLRRAGAVVDNPIVYQTKKSTFEDLIGVAEKLRRKEVDVVTFFSPSSVKSLIELVSAEKLDGVVIAAIGERTAQAVRDAGLRVDIIPPSSTSESMVEALVEFFRPKDAQGGAA